LDGDGELWSGVIPAAVRASVSKIAQ